MRLTIEHLIELLTLLSGRYTINACGGKVRLVARDLPGDAVAVLTPPVRGIMLLIYDLSKPDAIGHARDLLAEHWSSVVEPVAWPDGTVELVQRQVPACDRRPVTLNPAV